MTSFRRAVALTAALAASALPACFRSPPTTPKANASKNAASRPRPGATRGRLRTGG